MRKLLNESENKNLDLILRFFNLEWEEVQHSSTRKLHKYLTPGGISKDTIIIYLDSVGISPVDL